MTGTLVLLSGGMDSTSLLARVLREGRAHALGVNYGQRHARELEAATAITAHYGVPFDVVDLRPLAPLLASALTGHADIPHGHYSADNMAATVVPNRNAIMLMVAVGVAASRGLDRVVTAVHAGDHPIYPDCRPDFIAAASHAAELGTAGMGDVSIEAPYVNMAKAEIAAEGWVNGAPLHLSWSCYEGGELHCGRCGTCVERAEAFYLAGVVDPTRYVDATYWKQVTA